MVCFFRGIGNGQGPIVWWYNAQWYTSWWETFCYCVSRETELLTGEKHSAIVVAEQQKFTPSGSAAKQIEEWRMANFVHWLRVCNGISLVSLLQRGEVWQVITTFAQEYYPVKFVREAINSAKPYFQHFAHMSPQGDDFRKILLPTPCLSACVTLLATEIICTVNCHIRMSTVVLLLNCPSMFFATVMPIMIICVVVIRKKHHQISSPVVRSVVAPVPTIPTLSSWDNLPPFDYWTNICTHAWQDLSDYNEWCAVSFTCSATSTVE